MLKTSSKHHLKIINIYKHHKFILMVVLWFKPSVFHVPPGASEKTLWWWLRLRPKSHGRRFLSEFSAERKWPNMAAISAFIIIWGFWEY